MTPEQREQYERAAVALETHEVLPFGEGFAGMEPWAVIAWKTWDVFNDREPVGTSIHDIDDRAARLLRECIQAGTVLK